jgi:hypothetical protein
MPPRERRTVDLVLIRKSLPPRIIEVDETQHFNPYRATTILLYPRTATVALDRSAWMKASLAKTRLEGGGFGRPCPRCFQSRAVVTRNGHSATR